MRAGSQNQKKPVFLLVLSGVGGERYPGRERIEPLRPIEPLLSRLAISLRFDSAVALGVVRRGESVEEGELAISSQAYSDVTPM